MKKFISTALAAALTLSSASVFSNISIQPERSSIVLAYAAENANTAGANPVISR